MFANNMMHFFRCPHFPLLLGAQMQWWLVVCSCFLTAEPPESSRRLQQKQTCCWSAPLSNSFHNFKPNRTSLFRASSSSTPSQIFSALFRCRKTKYWQIWLAGDFAFPPSFPSILALHRCCCHPIVAAIPSIRPSISRVSFPPSTPPLSFPIYKYKTTKNSTFFTPVIIIVSYISVHTYNEGAGLVGVGWFDDVDGFGLVPSFVVFLPFSASPSLLPYLGLCVCLLSNQKWHQPPTTSTKTASQHLLLSLVVVSR